MEIAPQISYSRMSSDAVLCRARWTLEQHLLDREESRASRNINQKLQTTPIASFDDNVETPMGESHIARQRGHFGSNVRAAIDAPEVPVTTMHPLLILQSTYYLRPRRFCG
jgi:hypothetical protein